MGSFSTVKMIYSCGSALLLATTPITLPAALPSIALCAYDAYKWYKDTKAFADAVKTLDGNNGNTGCSVTASLNGGTLVIGGSGTLCTSEINKFADRKSEITKLIIGGGVTSIPTSAFSDCNALQSVEIKEGNEPLTFASNTLASSRAFYNSSIGTLYLKRNISYSGHAPFGQNTKLTKLEIGNRVTSINADCFNSCTGLTSVSFGSGLTSIGNNAFSGCINMASILNIPAGVTTIGYNAFYNCEKALSLVIPGTVNSIGTAAFSGCNALQSVEIKEGNEPLTFASNTLASSKAFYNSSIGTLYLKRNISYSGHAPFEQNTKLASLTIGDKVTSIGTNSFSGCTGITQITSNAPTPPTLQSNTFYNVNKTIPVYINCNYLTNYQSAQYWKDFTNYQCAVQITPKSNSAIVTFQTIANAATYTLGIYSDENRTNKISELHLDANGHLRDAQQTLSCTVPGLDANTQYHYSLTPYNADGNMLTVFEGNFTTTSTTGIDDRIVSKPVIFPNPAKTDIFIQSDSRIEKVEILSLTGNLLLTENNFSGKISLSSLPQGVYMVKIYTETGMAMSKFVKE